MTQISTGKIDKYQSIDMKVASVRYRKLLLQKLESLPRIQILVFINILQ